MEQSLVYSVHSVHSITSTRAHLSPPSAKAGGQIPGRQTVDVLDTATGEWGVLDPLNFGRGWLAGASAGDCAVFAGGDGRFNHSTVDAYCF